MDDLIRQGLATLRAVWNRRWVGVSVAWATALVASAVIWTIPDKYEASAKIFVDTQTILRPVMSGLAIQPTVDQQAALVGRTLISRPNIEKLIDSVRLGSESLSKRDREVLAEQLMRRLDLRMAGRENLYSLTYSSTDPVLTKRVVEALAEIFVESTRRAEKKDTAGAKAFLEEQIAVYEGKLREAENRLKDFRLRNLGISDSGKGYFGKMDELNTQLAQARLELREAENSRDALARQISGESPTVQETRESTQRPAGSELDARIDALQRNLDSLLQRFTEDHPDVVGARRVLASLEEQRRKERKSVTESAPGRITSSTANLAYQEIKVSLAKSEAVVASLKARVAEYESRYRQYKDAARQVPQIEAELAQLNRDYEINKKNYEGLVARRESLEIGGDMQEAGESNVRVVDPPLLPARPVAPNRLLLFAAGLVASLGAGMAASFATSRLWPRFHDPKALRDVTGLPVIGTISLRKDELSSRRNRRSLIGFVSAVSSLVALYFGSAIAFVMIGAGAH